MCSQELFGPLKQQEGCFADAPVVVSAIMANGFKSLWGVLTVVARQSVFQLTCLKWAYHGIPVLTYLDIDRLRTPAMPPR